MPIMNPNILTKEQKLWFGNRMDESQSGRVLVPTYLYDKFRKLTNTEYENHMIKSYLIDYCYEGN